MSPSERFVLLELTAATFQVTTTDILGPRRPALLVDARHCLAWCLRQRGMSYPRIGKRLGGRDHRTIMHAVGRVSSTPALLSVARGIDAEARAYYARRAG